jgi:hypothetical protein
MMDNEVTQLPSEPDNPYDLALNVYLRGVAAILLLLGLRHWLYIAGVFQDDGWSLETMSNQWRFVTINLAVVDLVAAVGLWMRVAWGNVIWVYIAMFEVAMHTVFADTFGFDWLIVSFHVVSLLVFVGLLVMSRRHEAAAS